jgi:hypothetical protein
MNNLDGALEFKKLLNEMYHDKILRILKINTKLINKIKLHYDPTYFVDEKEYYDDSFKAYYTYDNISPYAIEELL